MVVIALSDRNPRAYSLQPFTVTIVQALFLLEQHERVPKSASKLKSFVRTVKMLLKVLNKQINQQTNVLKKTVHKGNNSKNIFFKVANFQQVFHNLMSEKNTPMKRVAKKENGKEGLVSSSLVSAAATSAAVATATAASAIAASAAASTAIAASVEASFLFVAFV